jgi:tetratricopeptide (TPR) repeat protein
MIAKKKKLSRKEIKKDKLITTYYQTWDFVEKNSKAILMYTVVVVAAVLVVFFYLNNKKENNQTAALHLSRAIPIYESGNYLEAIEGREGTNVIGLKRIVDEYGSTENGNTAKIYLANSYSFLGKHDEAYKFYDDYSGSIDLFNATAIAGQAGYYANKGENAKAADLYRKASRVSEYNALNADYLLKAGINYLQAGNHSNAKQMFETVTKEHQNTSYAREVEKYLAQVNE